MTGPGTSGSRFVLGLLALVQPISAARADIVLSELIVELQSGRHNRDDVELWNNGAERAYVAIEPREVLDPGKPGQSSRAEPDPEKLGLLVAPARMILEPGQRKLVRIAMLAAGGDRERVYRVTVKPVAGPLASDASGLKVLIGYDVLVLVRPSEARSNVTIERSANRLTVRNDGNVSVELTQGRQCDSPNAGCRDLPGKRLYAGAQWTETLPGSGPAEYLVRSPAGQDRRRF
ncbi:fimbrial biogenesis chaperone [Sphingomonas sp. URHD0057]|uniref:fimbrial biogenesis chaperone n=1 Tax=Sphingomonas sp. URHD0057 TaxID=1380389 RepID=UPI00049117EE|nr:fimbria/pilus periplasmic chaperone [Sphingomonas sp. URHD0057]